MEATQNVRVHYSMVLANVHEQMVFHYDHVKPEGSYRYVRVPTKNPKDVDHVVANHLLVSLLATLVLNLEHPDLDLLFIVFLLRFTHERVVV